MKTITAYLAQWRLNNLTFRPGDMDRLTHVIVSFAIVKDGAASIDHWKNIDALQALIQNKGPVKIILSIGGWGAGGFSPAVATAAGREKLAQSYVDIINKHCFDGADLDWEFPGLDMAGIEASLQDKDNYTAWVKLLRQKLGPQMHLSMAGGAMQSCVDNLDIPALVQELDCINIMTYDMCPWDKVGYHTALFSTTTNATSGDAAINRYLAAGAPPEKLVLGAGFYAQCYHDVDGHPGAAIKSPPKHDRGHAESAAKAKAFGEQYDPAAETAFAYNSQTREFFSYDSPRSLAAKAKYVHEKNLAGIMFWEYSMDDENSTLLKAIYSEINEKRPRRPYLTIDNPPSLS
ncbi:MAG: glycosyl hydrolase family 18 protein [Defluviitaleaceae bacterium]|nr:glycosyl hydrolase family 18 protein [Defluviitaleaceae bacterium]